MLPRLRAQGLDTLKQHAGIRLKRYGNIGVIGAGQALHALHPRRDLGRGGRHAAKQHHQMASQSRYLCSRRSLRRPLRLEQRRADRFPVRSGNGTSGTQTESAKGHAHHAVVVA
ncbi:hypothetical protein [Pseudoduganella violaceinigra]|uniref:hypothetical protein n=1 Tax=Pseudoduganella violaceinigra TaxID=246602 RepID=UPI001E2F7DB1|nr:hypothetical protein [Pseudoduganella violaceinigra]